MVATRPEILLHAGADEVAEALAARLMARLTEIQRDFRFALNSANGKTPACTVILVRCSPTRTGSRRWGRRPRTTRIWWPRSVGIRATTCSVASRRPRFNATTGRRRP